MTYNTGINNNRNPVSLPPADPVTSSVISTLFGSIGIEATSEDSAHAIAQGGSLIAAAVSLPNYVPKIPSWVSPSLVVTGLGIAAMPTVKAYFSSFSQANPALEAPATVPAEPRTPKIPLTFSGKTPERIGYSDDVMDVPRANPATSSGLTQIVRAETELLASSLNVGGTPLFQQLARANPEAGVAEDVGVSEILERTNLAKRAVDTALAEIGKYIKNMKPILLAKIQLSSITDRADEMLASISGTNTINKIETGRLLSGVNGSIRALEDSISSLSEDIQTVVPAFDYHALNLNEAEKMIRENSLDDRAAALRSLTALKESYKTALDAVQGLCDLKDSIEELNREPTTEKLKNTAQALSALGNAIEGVERSADPKISAEWLKDVTKDYTSLLIDHLTAAAHTTSKELNAVMNLSKNTDLPTSRLKFLSGLKDLINKESLIVGGVGAKFAKLGADLEALKTAIATKKSWQPMKNALLLGLSSLGVTAALTTGHLATDVAKALWQGR
jgi:hypothetical protein